MRRRDLQLDAQGQPRRRDLLEWLGGTAVLALTSPLLKACTTPGAWQALPDDAGQLGVSGASDAALLDGAPRDASGVEESGPSVLDFAPGDGTHPIFEHWGERTVDRQDLASILASWQLTVHGLVESPLQLSFADLLQRPRLDTLVDFHCVEGWSILDVPWNGVHLSTLLDEVRPYSSATHVTFHTIDGRYNESLPLEIALEPRTLLAFGVGGSTLPLSHGFPLRAVVPRLWAYKSAKYVNRIEFTNQAVQGYWVHAGYPYLGEVPADRLRQDRF
ncbi:MAG: molybdopterin-dependent oxidoreductase [Pseudomonadota bacterium]